MDLLFCGNPNGSQLSSQLSLTTILFMYYMREKPCPPWEGYTLPVVIGRLHYTCLLEV